MKEEIFPVQTIGLVARLFWSGLPVHVISSKIEKRPSAVRQHINRLGLERDFPRYPRIVDLPGLGPRLAKKIKESGIKSVAQLSVLDYKELVNISLIGMKRAKLITGLSEKLLESIEKDPEPDWTESNDLFRIDSMVSSAAKSLSGHGSIDTLTELAEYEPETLTNFKHIGKKRAAEYVEKAREICRVEPDFSDAPVINPRLSFRLVDNGYFSYRSFLGVEVSQLCKIEGIGNVQARAIKAYTRSLFGEKNVWNLKHMLDFYLNCRKSLSHVADIKYEDNKLLVFEFQAEHKLSAETLSNYIEKIALVAFNIGFDIETVRIISGTEIFEDSFEGGVRTLSVYPSSVSESQIEKAQKDADKGMSKADIKEKHDLSNYSIDEFLDIPHPGNNCNYTEHDKQRIEEMIKNKQPISKISERINRSRGALRWYVTSRGLLDESEWRNYTQNEKDHVSPNIKNCTCEHCGEVFKNRQALGGHRPCPTTRGDKGEKAVAEVDEPETKEEKKKEEPVIEQKQRKTFGERRTTEQSQYSEASRHYRRVSISNIDELADALSGHESNKWKVIFLFIGFLIGVIFVAFLHSQGVLILP